MFFLLIVAGFPVTTLLWWFLAHRAVANLPDRWRLWLRVIVALFAIVNVVGLLVLIGSRIVQISTPIPLPLLVKLYVWYFFVTPCILLPVIFWRITAEALGLIQRLKTARNATPSEASVMKDDSSDDDKAPANHQPPTDPILAAPITRRQLLVAGAIAAPPLFNIAGSAHALAMLDHFRVRRLAVEIPNLPASLEGFRIAHLSDTHVGRFTNGKVLEAIARRTNELESDLVVVTGDIVDNSLRVLPETVRFLRSLQGKHGVYLCEGNHDLIESRARFEGEILGAGLNLLVNEQATLLVDGGHSIELTGLRWGGFGGRRSPSLQENLQEAFDDVDLGGTGAGPLRILLAHHPHAADFAHNYGIHVTLAGHTHGGQLMLTDEIGAGPLLFRYWTGIYDLNGQKLVVSNGTGNWFPMRTGAPAEILELSLTSGRKTSV